ncbi:hypothetical protein [Enterovirga aerilata]|uniref:Phospholipase A2 domain-containing protein n=1 Tax=Enterovirga aerilata TaxID=2730920 RepID=A0A849I428_9HYPH|nr:hypothetical protein [Enterovirga sp. DB1703]NNM72118.1 hypothetical protein [Enterovirga sp. DB1703]
MTRWIRALALVASLVPLGAAAQQEHPLPDETTDAGALQYDAPVAAQTPDKPLVPSFQKKPSRAGGPANELNTGDRRSHERLPGGDVAATVTGADLFHGNFCGRGNRGDELLSTDPLDEVCKRHDECFDLTNRSCSCNETLRLEAYRVAELKTVSRELRARAAGILQAAPAIPCRAP